MAKVLMPQQKNWTDYLGPAGQVVGGAIGAVIGGPAGALAGAGAGGMGGSLAKFGLDEATGEEKKLQAAAIANNTTVTPAMQRLQQLENDPVLQIRAAQAALPALPESMRQEYQPALEEAQRRALAARKPGGVYV